MIEVIVVIAVAGILAVAFLPRITLVSGHAAMAADVIASDIRLTQREAMRREIPLSVTLAAGNTSYKYALYVPISGETRNLAEIDPNLVITQGRTITFNSLGEPVALTVPLVIAVTDGEAVNNIMVEPYTGMVTTQ